MPIYEYQCQSCGHQTEVLQKVSDKPLIKCSECGRNKMRRLVSATAFQLKGEGWYVTDFRDKNKKTDKTATAEKTESVSASATAEPKAENTSKKAKEAASPVTKAEPAKKGDSK